MIWYFSGTGNSQWVAQELGKLLSEPVQSLVGQKAIDRSDRVIVVSPIYAWSIPGIVRSFIEKLDLKDSAKLHLVVTCGDNVGQAIKQLAKTVFIHSAYSVIMPNNYVIGFDVDPDDLVIKKLHQAKLDVEKIASEIAAGSAVWRYEKGRFAWYFGGIAGAAFNRFGRSTKPFFVEESCIQCGLCAKNCPVQMIKLVEGRPLWRSGSCEMCLRCLHACPVAAIQYGKMTKSKGRYLFNSFQKNVF